MSGDAARIWVVGRGGLLGRHVSAAIAETFGPDVEWLWSGGKFRWGDAATLGGQVAAAADSFIAASRTGRAWAVLWTAGAGIVGAAPRVLEEETEAFRMLLAALTDALATHRPPGTGLVFLSSSAGGVFGGSADMPVTERSSPRPISEYGENKLRQERLLQAWGEGQPRVVCGIGRISNLLGVGQNLAKPQGLVSQMCRCVIWQKPIHLYVPLDTIRDYLHAQDCGLQIASCVASWLHAKAVDPGVSTQVKLLASGTTLSVAQVVNAFTRLGPAPRPKVICSPSAAALQQPRCLRFRSVVAPDVGHLPSTPIAVSANEIFRAQLALYCRGELPPP